MHSLADTSFTDLQALLKYALEQKDIADAAGHSGTGIDWATKIDRIRQAIAVRFDAI